MTVGQSAGAAEFTEPAPSTGAAPASGTSGVLGEVSGVIAAARRVATGLIDLVVLEGQRAALALAWMLGLGLAAGVLAIAAWIGLMAMAALGLMAAGCAPVLAILAVVVLNLAAAGGAVFVCVKKSKQLLFPATRRQLSKSA